MRQMERPFRERVIIMGAAGRDFHNFNMRFKYDMGHKVVAFTATQIYGIANRVYPYELAGPRYPQGIPIYPERDIAKLIKEERVGTVVFSYSDVSHEEVMHKASFVNSLGADFTLLGAQSTMLESKKPVISVCAVRTGCGKSQTTRKVCDILKGMGKKVVVVRHPMPYGDLKAQAVQGFYEYSDFEKHNCTIEEREEYEPLVAKGITVFAGVNYNEILQIVEKEADVIVWDGGNNDTPFFRPDVHIVLFDPHRLGHEFQYHPGETNLLMADIAIINKVDTAQSFEVDLTKQSIERYKPKADIVLAKSPVTVEEPDLIMGKNVLVIEDGPTLTHGGMTFGAGSIAAANYCANYAVDPRRYVVGQIKEVYSKYPHLGNVIPAMGYGENQIKDLQETINRVRCDVVLSATPVDLSKIIKVNKPVIRVKYEYGDHGNPTLEQVLLNKLNDKGVLV